VSEAAIEVTLNDEEGDATATIELMEDGVVVATDEPAAAHRTWSVRRAPTAGKHYYFVKVTQMHLVIEPRCAK